MSEEREFQAFRAGMDALVDWVREDELSDTWDPGFMSEVIARRLFNRWLNPIKAFAEDMETAAVDSFCFCGSPKNKRAQGCGPSGCSNVPC